MNDNKQKQYAVWNECPNCGKITTEVTLSTNPRNNRARCNRCNITWGPVKKSYYRVDWPFRQADENWGNDVMWDRTKVMKVLKDYNGIATKDAEVLLENYGHKKNNIANEGCLVTSLAMVLKILHPKNEYCSPNKLNEFAKKELYYSESGIALTTLYSDLVLDATDGDVQLAAKEEYPWVPGKAYTTVSCCAWTKAYLNAPQAIRQDFAVIIKIGTHDDSFASHFLLLDPRESIVSDNPLVLDPGMPDPSATKTKISEWQLTDSFNQIISDYPKIKKIYDDEGIKENMIRGVWLFGRWRSDSDTSILEPLFPYLS